MSKCFEQLNLERNDGDEHPSTISLGQSKYEAYREVQDLPEPAKVFYKAVGEYSDCRLVCIADYRIADAAGLGLAQLVRAVYMLEQRILRWQGR